MFIGFVNMAPLDYRSVVLRVGGYRVKQLTVVGVAAESFWKKAFHERRGLSSLGWADVASVTLLDAMRVDSAGREKRMESAEVALTRAYQSWHCAGRSQPPLPPVDSSKMVGFGTPAGSNYYTNDVCQFQGQIIPRLGTEAFSATRVDPMVSSNGCLHLGARAGKNKSSAAT